ncbi:MAG TPA: alpha/beta hydrolase [Nocardioides sp.]|uniref:alpha/beta fold hydrolase n=1 Tax=Nocardioides sp. TaxID=35761 RepID=UPI002F41B47F
MNVTSGSAQLATESHGDGEPSVLLVHAGVTDQRSWRHVVDRLPDHRCLTYDQRGYGRTTYEHQDGWSGVEDAVAVLDAYDVDSAVVVACSMGGRVALHLALTHPERVRALVLIAPAITGGPGHVYEPEVQALSDASDAAWERGDLDEVNRLDARVWLDGPLAPDGRVDGEARELFLEMNRIAIEAEEPGDQDDDVDAWPRLGEITVPTLLMIGDLDLQYLQEYVAHAASAIPNARLVELPGVAHLPHLEADERTLAEITAFVSAL